MITLKSLNTFNNWFITKNILVNDNKNADIQGDVTIARNS